VWGLPNLKINIVSCVLVAMVVASTTLALVFACVPLPYPLILRSKGPIYSLGRSQALGTSSSPSASSRSVG
jgi:hypothetical protein